MKKILAIAILTLIAITFAFCLPTDAVLKIVEVSAPSVGAEWEMGSTQTITWVNSKDVKKVNIELWQTDGTEAVLVIKENEDVADAEATEDVTNSFEWTIPETLTEATDYIIRVIVVQDDAEAAEISNDSDEFSIIEAALDYPTTISEDFESYTIEAVPNTPWVIGVDSSYTADTPNGATIKNTGAFTNYLSLMEMSLEYGSNYGADSTGYTYAQYIFQPESDGTLTFDYFHSFPTSESDLACDFEFWMDLELTAIENPTAEADLAHLKTDEVTPAGVWTSSEAFPVTADTVYKLTWKATKEGTGHEEDMIRIDNILFTPASK